MPFAEQSCSCSMRAAMYVCASISRTIAIEYGVCMRVGGGGGCGLSHWCAQLFHNSAEMSSEFRTSILRNRFDCQ